MGTHRPMSADELMQLQDAVQKHGFQWRRIACEHFPGRSEDSVRNQYNRSFGVKRTQRIRSGAMPVPRARLPRQRTTSSSRAPIAPCPPTS